MKRKASYQHNIAYLLIAPFYFFITIFILLPILINLYLSFTNYDLYNLGNLSFTGVANYIRLFQDEFFLKALSNTSIYSVSTLFGTIAVGFVVALLVNNNQLFGVRFYRTCFFIPHITSMVAAAMIWVWLYEPAHGIINMSLSLFGIRKIQWLYDTSFALPAVIAMSIWKYVGYNMLIFLAGLKQIPDYLYESATIDGANMLQKLRYITIPLLRPIFFFLFVTGSINSFRVFEQIMILTEGGPINTTTTIVHQIYIRAFNDFQMGYACSMAIFLLFIVAAITLINLKFGTRWVDVSV